jgi:tetratricopeptide (TPR) repeat protein
LSLDARNVESLVNLGIADKQDGRRDDARAALARALEIDPHGAEANYNLGLLADEAGEKTQALAHYRAFLQYGSMSHPDLVADVRKRVDALAR